ncbi:hypothetical protein D3C76_1741440 [compost metagenome]
MAPTGDVDSRMTKSPFLSTGAMLLLADSMYVKSGTWSPMNGVGTAIRNASAGSGWVVARK